VNPNQGHQRQDAIIMLTWCGDNADEKKKKKKKFYTDSRVKTYVSSDFCADERSERVTFVT